MEGAFLSGQAVAGRILGHLVKIRGGPGTGTWSDVPSTSKPVADPVITEIAKEHEVTPAQAILRWNLQHGWVPIPKSENGARMRKNIDLKGLALNEAEMTRIVRKRLKSKCWWTMAGTSSPHLLLITHVQAGDPAHVR